MELKFSLTICLLSLPLVMADLRIGFYQSTCPQAESIVRQIVQKHFASDKSVTPALLRLHFHDCFVRGCDASILIDSTNTTKSEKDAGANQTVRGFELIDEIKKALETTCPSTVSCADIITLATRDAVALSGGPSYSVPTGRRDGLVSNENDVNLPGPTISVSGAFQFFSAKGLTLNEMVTLLGAHSVGVAHCSFFSDRVSNFQGTGKPDPTMDPTLASKLNGICNSGSDPTVFLDQNTSFVLDNVYYRELILKRGIMQIDQELTTDRSTVGIVSSLTNNNIVFKQNFANAIVKMGSIGVLVNNAGEVRTNCKVFNAKNNVKAPSPTPPKKTPVPSPSPPSKAPVPTPSPSKKAPVPSPGPPKRAPVPSPGFVKKGPVPRPGPVKKGPVSSPRPRPVKKSTPQNKFQIHKKRSNDKHRKPKAPPSRGH